MYDTVRLVPMHNSLSKASALKVDTALRKILSHPHSKGERHKNLATYPSCLESYILELVEPLETWFRTGEHVVSRNILAQHKNLSTPDQVFFILVY